ncbi:cAMP/cGMP-dependent 3',5'-cyclic-AMP/GMP phosphodiesterase [Balamuthia mandrillaris]
MAALHENNSLSSFALWEELDKPTAGFGEEPLNDVLQRQWKELCTLLQEEGGCTNLLSSIPDLTLERGTGPDEDARLLFAQMMLGSFAVVSKAPLAVSNQETAAEVAQHLAPFADVAFFSPSATPHQHSAPVRVCHELIVAFSEVEAIQATRTTTKHLYATIHKSIQMTNLLFFGVRFSNPNALAAVLRYLSSYSSSNSSPATYIGGRWGEPTPYYSPDTVQLMEGDTFVYHGSFGPIQIGIPPETIKVSMRKGASVPQIYVLPPRLFEDGVNYGDVEFPIYFNFFIKKAFIDPKFKVRMIGTEDQLERVRISFQESVFGPKPEHLYMDEDIADCRKEAGYAVDFLAERGYLAYKDKHGNTPPVTHFADFSPYDEHGVVDIAHQYEHNGVSKVVKLRIVHVNDLLCIYEDNKLCGILETYVQRNDASSFSESREEPVNMREKQKETMEEENKCLPSETTGLEMKVEKPIFEPPVLGVTFIGTSHGFDPAGKTTGFIIWINGYGVLVDPPVETPKFLEENGINHRFVSKVILTHCHSDHDSGLIRIILGGRKIELYTTKTVNESYKRKLNAITNLVDVQDYYIFRQVKIGEVYNILGANFEFDYSFHTIPTVRFKLRFHDKSISYSADTYYGPRVYAQLVADGIINYQREISLRQFLFDADMIIHESGCPPIHTSISDLNDLPTATKKKMWVVHCSGIPESVGREVSKDKCVNVKVTHLKIPKCGTENTVILPISKYHRGYAKATRLFKMFCDIWYFRNISPNRMSRMFSACTQEAIKAGEVIVKAGEESDTFFLIEQGKVNVYNEYGSPQQKMILSLGRGDTFGETALMIADGNRTATVRAATDCKLLTLAAKEFRDIMADTEVAYKQPVPIDLDLSRIHKYRPFLRNCLSKSFLFSKLKPDQLESIAAIIDDERVYEEGQTIFQQGDVDDSSLYIIKEGSVRLEKTDPGVENAPSVEFMRLSEGESFGEMSLITGLPRTASAIANKRSVVLSLRREDFTSVLNKYQNIRYHITALVSERLKETQRVDRHIQRHLSSQNVLAVAAAASSTTSSSSAASTTTTTTTTTITAVARQTLLSTEK